MRRNPKKKRITKRTLSIKSHYGIVIFLDALGTKGSWEKSNPETLIKRWDNFVLATEKYYKKLDKKFGTLSKLNAFSDTFIITITTKNIQKILDQVGRSLIATFVIGLLRGISFRGCISAGKFFTGEKIVIGPAVDEAARYSSLPNWVGVSAAPSMHVILDKLESLPSYSVNSFQRHDIPMKHGIEKNGWVLSWHRLDLSSHIFDVKFNKIADPQLVKIITKKHNSETDINNVFKWRNTLDYVTSK